ncbi:hypothetical protein ACHQM5_002096 [Ranunculus cassubicifolius]
MDEDNGLELSLGLSFGGSNGKLKGKDCNSTDVKIEEGGSNSKLGGELKDFFGTTTHKQDIENLQERSEGTQSGLQTSKESFFTNLAKSGSVGDSSSDLQARNAPQVNRFGDVWVANSKSPEVEELISDKKGSDSKLWLEASNKRKMSFEEMNRQKKHERENQHSDAHGRQSPMVSSSVRASHASVTSENGSTAENEDVAESEINVSTSGVSLHHEDVSKHYNNGGRGSSDVSRERYGHQQSNAPPANDPRHASMTYGTSLPHMTVQYAMSSKTSGVNGESNASGFSSPSIVQLAPASNDRPGSQIMNPCNLPLTFGYSPLQLPTLNNERSWGSISNSMQIPSPYAGRNINMGAPNSDRSKEGLNTFRGAIETPPHSSSEALVDERKTSELTKGGGKHHAIEENAASSSIPSPDETRGNTIREGYQYQPVEGILENSAIKPGIAPGMKFGGSGSYPDLPWVSTTAPGPNGRTISGVTYKYDKNQIKIVCACHGTHMTPEEFVQHASAADQQNLENNNSTGLVSFPNGNPAASAQS